MDNREIVTDKATGATFEVLHAAGQDEDNDTRADMGAVVQDAAQTIQNLKGALEDVLVFLHLKLHGTETPIRECTMDDNICGMNAQLLTDE